MYRKVLRRTAATIPQFVVIPETQPQNPTIDHEITSPIVISNRNQQVMQFVQISQPAIVIATSSSNVNKVQTRKIKSDSPSNVTNDSNATPPAPNQKQKSNKGVKKGTVRAPYKKKNQENIENIQK